MNEFSMALVTASWLGFLCAVSPCPLATNIAAISFVSRKVGSVRQILATGLLYTLGRTLTYTLLGILLLKGLTAAPNVSFILQKYMNLVMGPLLILVAMVMLKLLKLPTLSHGIGASLQQRIERFGSLGALFLGILFALSFCPTSAALFFGSLLPLSLKVHSSILLPSVFGIATGLPVVLFAFLLAFSAHRVGRAYERLAKIELWGQRITGGLFLVIGLGMTFTVTLGLTLW